MGLLGGGLPATAALLFLFAALLMWVWNLTCPTSSACGP